MKEYYISGFKEEKIKIDNIFLDLNGTINHFGKIPSKLPKYIKKLKKYFNLYIISANTRGDLQNIAKKLDIFYKEINKIETEQDAKLKVLEELDPKKTIVIGNGNNDAKALKKAIIGIAVIGPEGTSINALNSADIIVKDIFDAFNIILNEKALVATLRN
ncbi:MAG: HAD family hydrolase [Promethearchaeota archaeon]